MSTYTFLSAPLHAQSEISSESSTGSGEHPRYRRLPKAISSVVQLKPFSSEKIDSKVVELDILLLMGTLRTAPLLQLRFGDIHDTYVRAKATSLTDQLRSVLTQSGIFSTGSCQGFPSLSCRSTRFRFQIQAIVSAFCAARSAAG